MAGSSPGEHQLVFRFLASLGIFGIVLVGSLEIALRINGQYSDRLLMHERPAPDGYPVVDPAVGHSLKPNASGLCRRTEFSYPVRSNSLGFRDDEVPRSKDADEMRLWVLGDSVTAGYGVREEERFTEQLERILNTEESISTRNGKHVRVVNAGVGGHGTYHEALVVDRFFERISPDAILLEFTTTNDFNDNIRFARWKKEGGPYYMFAPAGSPWKAFLRDRLHIYHFFGGLLRWDSGRGKVGRDASEGTIDLLERIRGRACSEGIPLTVAVMAVRNSFEELDDPASLQSDSYRRALEVLDDGGFHYIDTVALLRSDPGLFDLFYEIDVHPNAEGHSRLAEILSSIEFFRNAADCSRDVGL